MNKENVISFLEDHNIDSSGKFTDSRYTLELSDSDEYARYYTILDHSDDLDLNDASSMSEEFATVITYTNIDYKVRLNANFTDDYYTLTVEDRN